MRRRDFLLGLLPAIAWPTDRLAAQSLGHSNNRGRSTFDSPLSSILTHWFAGGVNGKKIVFVGDSTTSTATGLFTWLTNNAQQAGQPLAGVTILNYGENGATLSSFLADSVTHGITNTIAASGDLYVFCYGINDVRLGATDQPTLHTRIVSAVTQIRAALATSDIVLWGPNSFLTTDVGGSGYVSPNTSAQVYTNILYNAYAAQHGAWPNVAVVQKQDAIFTRICQASTIYMSDQLHPSTHGQQNEGQQITANIGSYP